MNLLSQGRPNGISLDIDQRVPRAGKLVYCIYLRRLHCAQLFVLTIYI